MVLVQKELKNAYIGDGLTLEYDFTKSDCWWTYTSWTMRDSNWFYNPTAAWSKYLYPSSDIFGGTPKKIIISYNKTASNCWIGLHSSTNNYICSLPRNSSYLNQMFFRANNSDTTQNLGSNPTWDIVWEMDIDSSTTNWTVTHKITWLSSFSETKWILKYFFENKNLQFTLDNFDSSTYSSFHLKSIKIEY